MKKIIIWSLVSIIIAGIAVDAFLWLRKPQIVTLSDGTKLTLLGVTYGKHHVAPKIKAANGRARGNAGARIDSTNNTVVVWIEAQTKPNQYPNYQLLVYDQANTACVSTYARAQSQNVNGSMIQGFLLDAYPRWESKMVLRVMSYANGGQRTAKEFFVISNPARDKSFAKWTAEPLPDTQSDGDLDVTLTKLIANASSPYSRGTGVPRNDPMNKCVQITFDIQQKGQSVTNWHPVRVETSDAAGNHVTGWINQNFQNGQAAEYFYQPGLWPDEPAWKLRLEFSQTSGFSDDEVWTITNVPVQPGSQQDAMIDWGNSSKTKTAFAETTVNGIHLKLFPAIQYPEQNQGAGQGGGQSMSFSLKADPDPESEGMRVTVFKASDDQGRVLQNQGASWGGGNYQYQYSNVRNVKALNLTLVLHKSRFVEFTVKPEKATSAAAQ